MTFTEHAAIFPCVGDQLLCIIAVPELTQATGILIVVGGPQYRACGCWGWKNRSHPFNRQRRRLGPRQEPCPGEDRRSC